MKSRTLILASCLISLLSQHTYAQTEVSDQETAEAFAHLKDSEQKRQQRQAFERAEADKRSQAEEAIRTAEHQRKLELEKVRLDAEHKKTMEKMAKRLGAYEEAERQRNLGYFVVTQPSVPSTSISAYVRSPRAGVAIGFGNGMNLPPIVPLPPLPQ